MKRQQDCVGRERNAVNLHDWETEWRKKREKEQRESHAHHSSLCVAYRAWENRRDLTFPSFPHIPPLYPSSLPPSLFLQGLLNDRKWGRRLVKEGKQSNEGFMLSGGRKRKVPCHTHASGETEFTVHLPFLWGVSLIQGLFNEIRA